MILPWTIDDIVKLAKAVSNIGQDKPFNEIDIQRRNEKIFEDKKRRKAETEPH